MTELVPGTEIEKLVGHERDEKKHWGRADSSEQQIYILHSKDCLAMHNSGVRDLRECPFSRALTASGLGYLPEDEAVPLRIVPALAVRE